MSTTEAEVFDPLRSVGVSDDKASAAAQAFSRHDQDIAILKTEVTAIKAEVAAVKADMLVLKWMVGFVGAVVASLVLRSFAH